MRSTGRVRVDVLLAGSAGCRWALVTLLALAPLSTACSDASRRSPSEPAPPAGPGLLPLAFSTEHFLLRHDQSTAGLVAAYAAALEESWPRITGDLGVGSTGRIEGHLHPDQAAFTRATGYAGATGSVDGPNRFHIVAAPFSAALAVHEFAHNVTLHVNPGAGDNPVWLWESVALFEAAQLVPPASIDYLASGDFPRFDELGRGGRYSIYDVGFTIAECIVDGWGREGLRRMILAAGDAPSALGVSLDELERRWRRCVEGRYFASRRAASSVAASAGKNASTRSSWSVMSCGVPRLVSVEKNRRWRSPLRNSIARNGAVETSRSSVRQRGGTPG
jgi:hypothetical protein